MKKMMSAWTAIIVLLASAGLLVGHHSLVQFDTTTAVRVKGSIVWIERVNPHSILFVDQKSADGQIHRWAVEGPSPVQLKRRGFDLETLKVGDVIEACGYATKEGVEPKRTVFTEPVSLSLKSMSGRRLDGELLVMSDGRKEVWSDYGHHKCLGPDYNDFYVQ